MFGGSRVPAVCEAITPSDSARQSYEFLFVGGAGTVTIEPEGTTTTVQLTVPAGGYVWCRTSRILATGTAATLIRGFRL